MLTYALRLAWIWLPLFALLSGPLPGLPASPAAADRKVDEWDGEVLQSTSGSPSATSEKKVDELESDIIK